MSPSLSAVSMASCRQRGLPEAPRWRKHNSDMSTRRRPRTTRPRRLAAAENAVLQRLGWENARNPQTATGSTSTTSGWPPSATSSPLPSRRGTRLGSGGARPPFQYDPADPWRDARHPGGHQGRAPQSGRGTWVTGHHRRATHSRRLVFPEHAENPAFELDDSRISKLWAQGPGRTRSPLRGGLGPASPRRRRQGHSSGLLAAGLAEHVFQTAENQTPTSRRTHHEQEQEHPTMEQVRRGDARD